LTTVASFAIRTTVAEVEAELEEQLGAARFDQLRQLLIELNATAVVRGGLGSQAYGQGG
jgi:hypothetical protein